MSDFAQSQKITEIQGFFGAVYQQIVYCALFTTVANISYYYLHTIHSSTNTYVNCSGALKSSRAIKQLVSGALLDLIDHDITNCGLSHGLGGSSAVALRSRRTMSSAATRRRRTTYLVNRTEAVITSCVFCMVTTHKSFAA